MTIRELRRLQVMAVRGDRQAQKLLISQNDMITARVNKNLRELERAGYDFGAYGEVTNFTSVEYGTNRLKKARDLDGDFYEMSLQSQIGMKFLSNKSSTVEGQREIERKRIATLKKAEVIPENISARKAKNFLRFLGEEESKQVIESYGESEKVIDMMYEAYQKKNNSKNKMRAAFAEYLDGRKDFYDTMESLGVDPYKAR